MDSATAEEKKANEKANAAAERILKKRNEEQKRKQAKILRLREQEILQAERRHK